MGDTLTGAQKLLADQSGAIDVTRLYDGMEWVVAKFTGWGPFGRGVAPKGTVTIKEGKWDYFFGRVKSSPHNETRSLQNLKDLETLGFPDTEAGRAGLTRLFEIGRHLPEASRHTTQYGITITRRVPAGNGGVIDVKYFYPGGDLNAVPEISTIIPKIFK